MSSSVRCYTQKQKDVANLSSSLRESIHKPDERYSARKEHPQLQVKQLAHSLSLSTQNLRRLALSFLPGGKHDRAPTVPVSPSIVSADHISCARTTTIGVSPIRSAALCTGRSTPRTWWLERVVRRQSPVQEQILFQPTDRSPVSSSDFDVNDGAGRGEFALDLS